MQGSRGYCHKEVEVGETATGEWERKEARGELNSQHKFLLSSRHVLLQKGEEGVGRLSMEKLTFGPFAFVSIFLNIHSV